MFGARQNAKKPDQALIKKFQKTFSGVVRPTKSDSLAGASINPNDLGFFPPQPTPGLRFTPFLDDHSLPTNTKTEPFYGLDTVFHGAAGDLHSPAMGSNPLIPKTPLEQFAVTPLHGKKVDPFQGRLVPQYLAPGSYRSAWGNQSTVYTPNAFVGSAPADGSIDKPSEPLEFKNMDNPIQLISPEVSSETNFLQMKQPPGHYYAKFRYQVELNAPTAMIYNIDDAPVTYLNKGQTYSLTISDSNPPPVTDGLVRYRTSIRISFEEEEQTSKAKFCWGRWKSNQGRETPSHAVEFVNLSQDSAGQVQLERSWLDGFAVIWHADPTTVTPFCSVNVRFNFLSTDFSHSKGVKGASLRLCAKTETTTITSNNPELSFCSVKLFRDHGAERKMFNDVSQLKRAIEKRKTDFSKNAGLKDNLGKRKRGDSAISMSEHDLEAELAKMQGIFLSNRPVSSFCLRGEKKDDPDLFPVYMEDVDNLNLQTVTPPPSTLAGSSRRQSRILTGIQPGEPHPGREQAEWNDRSVTIIPTSYRSAESFDINPKSSAPAACFYINFKQKNNMDCHTAVYVAQRTAHDLAIKISQKQNISKTQSVHLFHVKPNGVKILVDDDVVSQIPEGQVMTADVSGLSASDNAAIDGGSAPVVEVYLYF